MYTLCEQFMEQVVNKLLHDCLIEDYVSKHTDRQVIYNQVRVIS